MTVVLCSGHVECPRECGAGGPQALRHGGRVGGGGRLQPPRGGELETKVAEDYAEFYHHAGPSPG